MSTLEKAIGLLQEMPENKLEAVYMYIRFVDSQADSDVSVTTEKEKDIERRKRGFQELLSFAGTLPEDFDYKKELEEARNEKYARFI
ncbi:MAG: hypothetical protein OSJ36_11290 [Odoribacter sp.]|nr:hypothetical protein [Odoribacter sp.]